VKRDLAALAKRDSEAAKGTAATLCLRLAEEIESGDPDVQLAARVSAGKLLAETMATLMAAVPAEQKVDRLDELTARRASRKARA
jgi:hypothetical protein